MSGEITRDRASEGEIRRDHGASHREAGAKHLEIERKDDPTCGSGTNGTAYCSAYRTAKWRPNSSTNSQSKWTAYEYALAT